ncbi:MAG: hypothetical protein ABMA26_26120 [Limisphaerales bacterium]
MARSVHTTKKQLVRERWFAHTDAVPRTDDATALERQDIQKRIHKTNEAFRRQAVRDDTPAHAQLALRDSKLTRTVNKRKTKQ